MDVCTTSSIDVLLILPGLSRTQSDLDHRSRCKDPPGHRTAPHCIAPHRTAPHCIEMMKQSIDRGGWFEQSITTGTQTSAYIYLYRYLHCERDSECKEDCHNLREWSKQESIWLIARYVVLIRPF